MLVMTRWSIILLFIATMTAGYLAFASPSLSNNLAVDVVFVLSVFAFLASFVHEVGRHLRETTFNVPSKTQLQRQESSASPKQRSKRESHVGS